MARIRSIHPGLFTDEAYMSLSLAGKVAFPGIWTECDDQGVFEWKPLVLKARIFPVDAVDMAAVLDELATNGCIRVIEVDGRKYGLVRNFRKWQRPEKPKVVFPLPEEFREYVGLATEEEDADLALRKAKFAEAGGKCVYCGVEVTYYSKRHNTMELDHKIPVSKGGSDDPDNLACSCRPCNRAKHDMTAEEFVALRSGRANAAKNGSRIATEEFAPPKAGQTPQMEDGGGRREEGGGSIALASDTSRAESQPSHPQTCIDLLDKRSGDLDQWEIDFLISIKWAEKLTKPQADKLSAIQDRIAAKGEPPKPLPTVQRGTPAYAAWISHFRATGKKTAWYEAQEAFTVPTKFPPGNEVAA